ncbi:hypothetical protein GCM10020229_44710 [Kitasatospora albolonga]|uniref:hypothetical protein n=1 Tax=Kitasatospora albolonga TaxID=68173 RepID=UPI0031EF6F74
MAEPRTVPTDEDPAVFLAAVPDGCRRADAQALTLYVAEGFERHAELLARLGPVTVGKGCLYVKRLDAVDGEALRELVGSAFAAFDGRVVTP